MSKTEQNLVCGGRIRHRPMGSPWDARKPREFDSVLTELGSGVIHEDLPYLVLQKIDPRDAEREEVEAFCTQLAFAEMRRCLDNDMGDELDRIAFEVSAIEDLRLVAASTGIRGGHDLVSTLKNEDRDFVAWQFGLVSRYLDYVSRRLDVPIEVVRP